MERDTRPSAARGSADCVLARGIVLSLALLVAGCAGHRNVQVAASSAPAPGSPTAGSVSFSSYNRSFVGDLIVIGTLLGLYYGSEREAGEYGVRARANPFDAIQPTTPAPEPDPSRRVLEQDCTRPLEDRSANLKCR